MATVFVTQLLSDKGLRLILNTHNWTINETFITNYLCHYIQYLHFIFSSNLPCIIQQCLPLIFLFPNVIFVLLFLFFIFLKMIFGKLKGYSNRMTGYFISFWLGILTIGNYIRSLKMWGKINPNQIKLFLIFLMSNRL